MVLKLDSMFAYMFVEISDMELMQSKVKVTLYEVKYLNSPHLLQLSQKTFLEIGLYSH